MRPYRRATRRARVVAPFALAAVLALLAGAALARTRPAAPIRPPASPLAVRPRPTGAATRASTSASPGTATAPARPAITASADTTPVVADRVVVGRWHDRQLIITEPFTTHGPWRICWTLPDAQGTFQIMIGDAAQTTWELRSGPVGATAGAFDVAQAGTFRLMPHNETPYTVEAVERPAGAGAGANPPPLCGG